MNTYTLIISIAIITYVLRVGCWLGNVRGAGWLERYLRAVPLTILAALIFPAVLVRDGGLRIDLGNVYLLAGLLTAFVAWRSRNAILTITVGMVGIILLKLTI